MRAFPVIALLLSAALVPVSALAVSPYVQDIVREDGSVDGAVLAVERAEQANIFAPGYEKFNILGTRITIDGWVENTTDSTFDYLTLIISARDIFGNALDTWSEAVHLPAGGRALVRCVLIVKDSSKLVNVTYKITSDTME